MKNRRNKTLPIYTFDLETDPFLEGRKPMPFAAGIYDGKKMWRAWGDACVEQAHERFLGLPPGIIYAHNGGRFDIYYCMDWIAGYQMRVINSRIIDAAFTCDGGQHSFRDSYAIMPFALGSYKGAKRKLDIDIAKLEADVRELHRDEILEYLDMDCVLLWELCSAFHQKFGDKLTIGSTAMKELRKFHHFKNLSHEWDSFIRGGRMPKPDQAKIRHGYYYGGRVECFSGHGVYEGDWKVYDVNSMYPHVMDSVRHPIGWVTRVSKTMTENTCFLKVEGRNYGAFPMRVKDGLKFDVKYGIFHVTRHEYDMAMRLGLFKETKRLLCVDFEEQGTFSEFVQTYYKARLESKAKEDAINEMFYKLILNSSYGKFSQNPDRYEDNRIVRAGWEYAPGEMCDCRKDDCECGKWSVKEMSTLFEDESKNYWVWRCNSEDMSRFNVATGASITGASRALLMQAIHVSTRTIYTDTDSVICEKLPLALDGKKLGEWKLEAEGTHFAMGGKKLYVLLDSDAARNERRVADAQKTGKKLEWVMGRDGARMLCVKKANKGVVITAQEIYEVAQGRTVRAKRDAPSFSLTGQHRFLSRDVRATV